MFMFIYTRPHTRVQASNWIYQNIEPGSTLSVEHWDDSLPLNLPSQIRNSYRYIDYPLYGQDNLSKWKMMREKLRETDYIIFSSNRLYGSITRASSLYPQTNKFYQDLFSGNLGFEKVAEFTSRPNIPLPGLSVCIKLPFTNYGIIAKSNSKCEGATIVDDYSNESNTVYDHPKVSIFKKVGQSNSYLLSK